MKATFLLFAVAAASIVNAATISSGTDAFGNLLAPNTADPFFSVTGTGATGVFTVANLYSGQYYNTPGNPYGIGTSSASWITTNQGPNGINGTYVFSESFVAGSSSLSGIWATDNCGSLGISGAATVTAGATIGSSTLAGCSGGNNSIANFHTPTAFTLSNLSIGTTYTVSFTVFNTEGPIALFVDQGPVGATPEPSSILSIMTGLGVVGYALRRRQSAK